jgi:N-acetylneuraminate synthase
MKNFFKNANTSKVFLIGEIGINHNGDVNIAKKIIKNAKIAGFDAVKFQIRTPDICVPEIKKKSLKETPWGIMTYLDYKKKIEFNYSQYKQIDKYCKKIKIDWFASCWDIQSVKFIKKFKVKYHKVPSAMITNLKLLTEIAKQKKMTFISTGMSTYKNINRAIKIFKKNKCKYMLMHSVSVYPCPDELLNLIMIKKLKEKYKNEVGYSGHEPSVIPSLIAASMGAKAIERHITLKRTMWGTDQSASLEFNGMKTLVDYIKRFEKSQGTGKKFIIPEEKDKLLDQKYW